MEVCLPRRDHEPLLLRRGPGEARKIHPKVFEEFAAHQRADADTSVFPTPAFFYGQQSGEEIIKFLTVNRWTQDQVADAAEQLILYSSLASDLAPGKRIRIEFIVLTKTKETSIDRHWLVVQPHQLDRTKHIVERVWQAISAGHFYPVPSAMNCGGCPFRDPCRKWPG